MDWRTRVLKQAVVGRLPFGDTLRRVKRRAFGYRPNAGNMQSTLRDLARIEEALKASGRSFDGAAVLEIGSGWFPIIPILMTLRGAKKVWLSDLNQHMDEVTFAETLSYLISHGQRDPRLLAARSIQDFPLSYLVPFKPSDVADGSIDLIVSRTVLEHIPQPQLEAMLLALRPKLSSRGVMVHSIDHSDHLEHFDKSISKVNFLTWSAPFHARINWLIKEGENRMRHHEYRTLFEKTGYRVLSEKPEIHEPTLALARTMKFVPPYDKMSAEQLAVLGSLYVLAPA